VIAKELLDILVCPACKKPLTLSTTETELMCHQCGRAFPIRDGIPILLLDEARKMTE